MLYVINLLLLRISTFFCGSIDSIGRMKICRINYNNVPKPKFTILMNFTRVVCCLRIISNGIYYFLIEILLYERFLIIIYQMAKVDSLRRRGFLDFFGIFRPLINNIDFSCFTVKMYVKSVIIIYNI